MSTVLYIHGMGGGGDSRIPRLLSEQFQDVDIRVVVRTYSFDPDEGAAQIASWVQELKPQLILGESLGSIQALRVGGLPHLFVSPSLGAPPLLYKLRGVCRFSIGRWYLHHRFPVKEGDRQPLLFTPEVLCKYRKHWEAAMEQVRKDQAAGLPYFAFFGTQDHFKKSGVVQVQLWRDLFGDTYQEYDGTHFMEEEYVTSLLIPKIREMLSLQK